MQSTYGGRCNGQGRECLRASRLFVINHSACAYRAPSTHKREAIRVAYTTRSQALTELILRRVI